MPSQLPPIRPHHHPPPKFRERSGTAATCGLHGSVADVPGARGCWGVVSSRDLLEALYSAGPKSAWAVEQASFPWDTHVMNIRGEEVVSAASRGYGIRRQRLLDICVRRALAD